MPTRSILNAKRAQRAQLIATLAQIAGLWIVSDLGYYLLLPALGVQTTYNAGSVAITLYYVFWVGLRSSCSGLFTADGPSSRTR